MAEGVEIYGTHGLQIINGQDKNLVLLEKLSWTLGAGITTFTVSNKNAPIVAIRSAAGAGVMAIWQGGSATTWVVAVCSQGAQTVTAYIFDYMPDTSTAIEGLQVFNAAGKLTYDITFPPLIVNEQRSDPVNIPSSAAFIPISAPAGRDLAAITNFSGWRKYSRGIPAGSGTYEADVLMNGAATAAATPAIFSPIKLGPTFIVSSATYDSGFTAEGAHSSNYVIIDVTGF